FQLLELNIISAQDLVNVSRKMRTYAVTWVHPDRKLTTRVDTNGRTNPTWNDKFVFRVDEDFLHADTSAVMIEIYAVHWFRDVHVGTVRVLVGNLIPPPSRSHHSHYNHMGMRFVALQVRRPSSGRPQGILNIGVALLDSSMRSMPLYTHLNASAVGYRHLMGEEDPHLLQHLHGNDHHPQQQHHTYTYGKPELRRTKSDTSSMVIESAVLVSEEKPKKKKKKKKASSVISGSELEARQTRKRSSRASSMINLSELAKFGKKVFVINSKAINDKQFIKYNGLEFGATYKPVLGPYGLEYGTPMSSKFPGRPIVTESELGPSPSEVAAAVAKNRFHRVEETESSAAGGWSLESSVEGLQSKLERWRSELPPVYDISEYTSTFPSSRGGKAGGGKHKRRHTDGEGLFSCFGNICGCECSIVCGSGSASGPASGSSAR
ncbi:C2 domain-containing protein, partial [Cephalotus follicularis]